MCMYWETPSFMEWDKLRDSDYIAKYRPGQLIIVSDHDSTMTNHRKRLAYETKSNIK